MATDWWSPSIIIIDPYELFRLVLVVVVAVRSVQVPIVQIVDVVAVGDGDVAAVGAVLVRV